MFLMSPDIIAGRFSPFLEKYRERVGRKRAERMVSTVEQKSCSAGDRAEFADFQFIAVDIIMVENIVLLEIARVVHKVVVNCVLADLDVRVGDD